MLSALLDRGILLLTPQLEEAIPQEVKDNPLTSTQKLSSHLSVWRVLHENSLYIYHIPRMQILLPRDFPKEWSFAIRSFNFTTEVFFTDKISFSQDAIRNFKKKHFWDYENNVEIEFWDYVESEF